MDWIIAGLGVFAASWGIGAALGIIAAIGILAWFFVKGVMIGLRGGWPGRDDESGPPRE